MSDQSSSSEFTMCQRSPTGFHEWMPYMWEMLDLDEREKVATTANVNYKKLKQVTCKHCLEKRGV